MIQKPMGKRFHSTVTKTTSGLLTIRETAYGIRMIIISYTYYKLLLLVRIIIISCIEAAVI